MENSGKMHEIDINIIYEDNHLLVVEKPVNVLSQGDDTGDADLLTILKNDIKERYNKPGNVYLGLVHRLDRPVGGVMAFARTSKAASRLSEQIRNSTFKKNYLAVVHRQPRLSAGRLENYLYKDSKTNTVRVVSPATEGAKLALLDYKVIEYCDGMSLVEVELHTGRPHQIRVQLSNTGHPLYGDQKYGGELNRKGQQIALWSYKIALEHPTTKQEMVFKCSPPAVYPWNAFCSER